jgi:hypothetical protein
MVNSCDFCHRFYADNQIRFINLDFSSTPVIIKSIEPRWFCGVRKLCVFCIKQIGSIDLGESNVKVPS